MITVAGFNTAIDLLYDVPMLRAGEVQRASSVKAYPGGKGLHVAQTIAALGESVQLVGLCDVTHRDWISQRMAARGVVFHAVEIESPLRRCLTLREAGGRITELLDPGLTVPSDVAQALLDTWWKCAQQSNALVMSGSLPAGFPPNTYANMVKQAKDIDLPCLVDASGAALQALVDARPQLIKPNAVEASALFGNQVTTPTQAFESARALGEQGIRWPVVTLGVQGSVGFDGTQAWHAVIEQGKDVCAVGSGDCFMAGMAVAFVRGHAMDEALRLATACGAANAANEEIGYATAEQVADLRERVCMRPLAA